MGGTERGGETGKSEDTKKSKNTFFIFFSNPNAEQVEKGPQKPPKIKKKKKKKKKKITISIFETPSA